MTVVVYDFRVLEQFRPENFTQKESMKLTYISYFNNK